MPRLLSRSTSQRVSNGLNLTLSLHDRDVGLGRANQYTLGPTLVGRIRFSMSIVHAAKSMPSTVLFRESQYLLYPLVLIRLLRFLHPLHNSHIL